MATVEPQTYSVQRRWPRLKIDVPLRLVIAHSDKTSYVSGRGCELNEGGMTVFAGVELRVDDEVEIEFTTPYSSEPIRVTAAVRDRHGYRYGVEFLAGSAEERKRVARLRSILQTAM